MFRHEGDQRPPHHNQILAGYLASIAGFVNSAGFILIGSFTSHVTGNVGRLANDLATDTSAAPFAALLVVGFFVGAFTASMALESSVRSRPRTYSVLLFGEAALLTGFAVLSYMMDTRSPRYHDIQAGLLCVAMGMQNSFVTRLSGAVVRTTHVTGVVTDLGIEAARWFRWTRARVGQRAELTLVVGDAPATAPQPGKAALLLTIVIAFAAGGIVGALLALRWGQLAMLAPVLALIGGGGYAAVVVARTSPLQTRS